MVFYWFNSYWNYVNWGEHLKTVIISVGGSILFPNGVDTDYLLKLKKFISGRDERFVLIIGGGKITREYQSVAKDFGVSNEDLDWVGIKATHLNAELVRVCFGVLHPVLSDPFGEIDDSRILIGAGFKPGSSTDLRAVQFANRLGGVVINISNTKGVYDKDPKEEDAKFLENINYDDFVKIVGTEWSPGLHSPFDPIALQKAREWEIPLFLIDKDLENLEKLLDGNSFVGTSVKNQ